MQALSWLILGYKSRLRPRILLKGGGYESWRGYVPVKER
eukprot:jgi/Botrbrau1/5857/Bobra.0366s0038.1